MKITLSKRIDLLAILLPCALVSSTTVHAEASKLAIGSGDSTQSRQHTTMGKEQWSDTRNLHQKVNKRTEKEWDKTGVAFDDRGKCKQGANINAC